MELLRGTSARQTTGGAAGIALPEARSPVLDLISSRWLIAARPLDETSAPFQQSGLARVEVPGSDSKPTSRPLRDVSVYENPDALPLAFAVHDSVVMKDDEGLQALKAGTFDPRKRVILDRAPSSFGVLDPAAAQGDDVTSRFEGDTIRVDATLSTPGFVVIGESWDPGWRATLWHGPWAEDRGDDLQVMRANVAFMAVWVPAGRHTIELRYWPTALTIGIGVAGLGALTLLVLTVWPRRRPKEEAPPSQP
jgi:hypothetical protein